MHPVMMLLQLNLIKANAEAGLERIMRILETETSIQEKPPETQLSLVEQDKIARAQNIPFIEFRNVSFAYQKIQVLNNFSCRIEHGQSVALAGPSGSGKTTFARLLLRLYDNQQGKIIINGHNIRLYSLQELRSNFGVVSQDPFLFQTTVYENVRVAHPEATKEDVFRAMEMGYVTEFIAQLPNGKCTEVGEAGFGLSGGQKQRVAIARAILGNPRYYIFDEATSALDNQSERRIQEAMSELGRSHSLIIIAHRLSTIRHVDKILVFDKGRIVQEGTYTQLAHTPGLFGDLLKNGE
jgi:ABC-type multidrug transport system fused ATPase/permease subunit